MVVLTCLAKAAVAARARRRDGDALAFGDAAGLAAQTLHHARDFVPQRNGLLDAHDAKTTVLVIMQIRAANAALGHIHAQLVFTQSGQFGVFNAQVFGRVADNGFHGRSLGLNEGRILECRGHAAVDIQDMAVHKA